MNFTHHDNTYHKDQENIKFDEILLKSLSTISQSSGRPLWAKLMKAFNYWLNIPLEKSENISEILQLIFDTTYLTDYVEIKPTTKEEFQSNIYRLPAIINSVCYGYCSSLDKTTNLNNPKATAAFVKFIGELYRALSVEIHWRENFLCPSEDEYKNQAKRKFGGYFLYGVQVMQLFSENQSDFSEICKLMGLYYKIRDDYLDLKPEKNSKCAKFSKNLAMGNFSFPIIHSISTNSKDEKLFNIMRRKTANTEVTKFVVDLMEKSNSFEYTLQVLDSLEQKIREQIKILEGNSYLSKILDELKIVTN